jgi:hypothetical protein
MEAASFAHTSAKSYRITQYHMPEVIILQCQSIEAHVPQFRQFNPYPDK